MELSTIRSQLKNLVGSCISSYAADVPVQITSSENIAHGDYSINIALVLSKKLKRNPMVIAKEISRAIASSTLPIAKGIDHVDIASPGFLNIFFKNDFIISHMYACTDIPKQEKQKIMVEYTDPNPFKEFHIGHLYSNTVGESLSRLLEALGNEVKRADYFGDVGMHVAKAIWGMQEIIRKDFNNSIDKYIVYLNQNVSRGIAELGKAYALGALEFDKSLDIKKKIQQLDIYIYLTAQNEQQNIKKTIDYKTKIGDAPDGALLRDITTLYREGKELSAKYFKGMFDRLGTKFVFNYPESVCSEYGYQLVLDGLSKGIFEKSEGAIIYRGEKEGFHTRVFVTSSGLPTYEAKELGLAYRKSLDYPFDLSISVTGNEINDYFKTVMSALSKIEPELAKKTKHIGHGMVRLKTGKMSSRLGNILTAEWLLDEAKKKIVDILNKGEKKYKKDKRDNIAERCAVAAIKYSLLKVSLPSSIDFDIDESINTEGDSGPYLLYTYSRCKSVLEKADTDDTNMRKALVMNKEERNVSHLLLYFPEILEDAALHYSPNIMCTYLYRVAQAFNFFYAEHQILKNPLRLHITESTSKILKKGLNLLGIETVEEM